LDSLDKAFLFLLGSINIAFALLQTVLGGQNAVLLFAPLLLIGLFFPFYIGYLRGAIVLHSVLERTRGWIYFAVGVTIYAASLATILCRDYYPQWPDLSLILYMLCYAVGYLVSRRWVASILRATETRLTARDLAVIGGTVGASLALSASVVLAEENLRVWISVSGMIAPEGAFIRLGSVAFPLLVFAVIERACRQLALSGTDLAWSYDVSSIRGSAGQVMKSSSACLLWSAMSTKQGFSAALLSFVIFFLQVSYANFSPGSHDVIPLGLGFSWLVLYVFATYKYLTIPIKIVKLQNEYSMQVAAKSADVTLESSHIPMRFGTESDYDLALKELRWLRRRSEGKLSESDLVLVARKYDFPPDFLEKGLNEGLSMEDRMIMTSKWFPVIYAWTAQRKAARRQLIDAYVAFGRSLRPFAFTAIILLFALAYLTFFFFIWRILEPIQLGVAFVFPYVTFAVPLLYSLWDKVTERQKEVYALFEAARTNGYTYLARSLERFIGKYARALAFTNFETLEKDIPEIVAYQIGQMPDGTPIAVAENPEQSYLARRGILSERGTDRT
jgi:hypothetical protein